MLRVILAVGSIHPTRPCFVTQLDTFKTNNSTSHLLIPEFIFLNPSII